MERTKDMSNPLRAFEIYPLPKDDQQLSVRGFFVRSTARIHVEDSPACVEKAIKESDSTQAKINEIAQHLIKSNDSQLVIFVHGYANKESDAEARSQQIFNYALSNPDINAQQSVFIGYRWPAENPIQDDPQVEGKPPLRLLDKIRIAFEAMPTLMLLGFISFLSALLSYVVTNLISLSIPSIFQQVPMLGLILGLLFVSSLAMSRWLRNIGNAKGLIRFPNLLLSVSLPLLLLFGVLKLLPNNGRLMVIFIFSIFFALFLGLLLALTLLRLVAYPSDRYRASNYGVYDLVELIRQIDNAFAQQAKVIASEIQQSPEKFSAIIQKRCAEITENKELAINSKVKLSFIGHSLGCEVITQTIRILSDVFSPEAISDLPDPKIGRMFRLERLVLAAPDIPLESIMPGRANYLRSSLRRFSEAHIFSNEGDLALRLASTAANYFSFPANSRFRGYKLGNITAKREKGKQPIYGFAKPMGSKPFQSLEIRSSGSERKTLSEFPEFQKSEVNESFYIADNFTYFDCTDYKDHPDSPLGSLSKALKKHSLNASDYSVLMYHYFFKKPSDPKHINTHGGYFDGEFSKALIYNLAFLGISSVIKDLDATCREKFIQVILSDKIQKP
jgi:Alpha/beta hydrolase of unknown function (DUF900)